MRANAALGVADQERQLAGGDDREAAGLVAGIDVGDVGDAVARHVVMVERLAELLRGKDLVFDGAVRGLLDSRRPSPPSPSAADATAAPNATASARRSCPGRKPRRPQAQARETPLRSASASGASFPPDNVIGYILNCSHLNAKAWACTEPRGPTALCGGAFCSPVGTSQCLRGRVHRTLKLFARA